MYLWVLWEHVCAYRRGGLLSPWPGSRLKPKHCSSPRAQFCHIICWQRAPAFTFCGQSQSHRFNSSCEDRKKGPTGAKFWRAVSPKDSYEQKEVTETKEWECQSSKDEIYVNYLPFYYSTLWLCFAADVLDLIIPDTINMVHRAVLALESKESQAMKLIHSTNRGCLCFSSLSVVQQELELVGDTHWSRLGGVEELALWRSIWLRSKQQSETEYKSLL